MLRGTQLHKCCEDTFNASRSLNFTFIHTAFTVNFDLDLENASNAPMSSQDMQCLLIIVTTYEDLFVGRGRFLLPKSITMM